MAQAISADMNCGSSAMLMACRNENFALEDDVLKCPNCKTDFDTENRAPLS